METLKIGLTGSPLVALSRLLHRWQVAKLSVDERCRHFRLYRNRVLKFWDSPAHWIQPLEVYLPWRCLPGSLSALTNIQAFQVSGCPTSRLFFCLGCCEAAQIFPWETYRTG
jgi:hypothetical protein